jgi:selenocysteine lyase/cysteine desulfurase
VHAALETYSNVHRGSGHFSQATTHLYEEAREIVLEHLELDKAQYLVIFSTPRRAEALKADLKPEVYQILSSRDIGLPLGVRAFAVKRRSLPRGVPFQTGGGTARLVFPSRVIWASSPSKFEAGTPAIVNVIAFAKALRLIRHFGEDAFQRDDDEEIATSDASALREILHHDDLQGYRGRELLEELKKTHIGRGVHVPTAEGDRVFINLDNGASTPTFAPIWEAVRQTWRQPKDVGWAITDEVRNISADLLGAPLTAYDLIFTANTTEAINLVAESLGLESEKGVKPVVVNTLIEHNSNELPWRGIPGASLIRFPVDAEGLIDLDALETLLRDYNQQKRHGKKRVKLVALSGASNVLGVYNHLTGISQVVHRYGARLLVDAAQLVAHRRVQMEAAGIDYLAFSAHKTYAPFGAGLLVARKGSLQFSPTEMEQIQSAGEENVVGIAALGKALLLLQRIGLDVIQQEEQLLTARTLRGLARIPGIEVFGIRDPDSPRFTQKGGVIVFKLGDHMADQVARELAERGGIGVRYGCHCAHLLIKHLLSVHPLLAQFQGLMVSLFPQISLPGLTRVSLGIENSAEEIDTLLQVLGEIARGSQPEIPNPFAPKSSSVQVQMEGFSREVARRVYAGS